MRKFASLLSVIALIMVTMAVSSSAQDATPPAAPMGFPESVEIAPGVVADNLLFAQGAEAPSVYRLTFEAGVVYPIMPGPSLELGYMESGALVMTLDVPVTVMQVGNPEGQGESVSPGTEFTLETGSYIVLQPGASGEIRNDSEAPAMLSVVGLIPPGSGAPAGVQDSTPVASPEG